MYAVKSRKEYLTNKVKTATPMELVVIVYDAAIGFLDCVAGCWEQRDFIAAGERIVKTQKCIRELKRALNMTDGKEIAENLHALYRYMDSVLTEASVKKDTAALERVQRMLKELRETWDQVAKQNPQPESVSSEHTVGATYINMYK